ncbi:hypothetical protein BGZ81_010965 [Podila clonocystis]|nr:hypothetical protein BGZ81_010965 [Podila clonocystis]
MNMLVDYESSSESDVESISSPQRRSAGRKDNADSDNKDESFISGTRKELRGFAVAVDASPGTQPKSPAGAATDDDVQFMSFMREIEAMPFIPDEPQGADLSFPPPPPPPPTSPPMSPGDTESPPPPPPPIPEEVEPLPPTETVYSIYTRIQNLGLLPVTAIDQKDLKRRLLEFAIRVKDWERGGLDPGYFLGHERVEAITAGQDGLDQPKPTNEDGLPAFGGIVGAMVKYMHELERLVTPRGWAATWDAEDEAYGFHHIQTGTYSPVYPSQEMITQLRPEESSHPYPTSGSHMSGRNHTSPYYTSTTKAPTSISTLTWQQPSPPVHTSLDKPNTPPTPATNRTSSPSSPVTLNPGKKKKRKAVEQLGDPLSPQDQHIHQSRRAIFTQKGPAPSTSSGGSKVMPKKLASLLQKWNEKDVDESDEDEVEENSNRPSSDRSAAVTGANSQSLGGDWREKRLNHR